MGTEPTVSQSVEVPVDPAAAFELYTGGINRWWRRDSWYWNDRERARGLRIEPFVGGRFVEVYDEATGEGFEIGRVTVWEPGRRVAYTWRQADWPPGEELEIKVTFAPGAAGGVVAVNVRGWERLAGGAELGRGCGEGAGEQVVHEVTSPAIRSIHHGRRLIGSCGPAISPARTTVTRPGIAALAARSHAAFCGP